MRGGDRPAAYKGFKMRTVKYPRMSNEETVTLGQRAMARIVAKSTAPDWMIELAQRAHLGLTEDELYHVTSEGGETATSAILRDVICGVARGDWAWALMGEVNTEGCKASYAVYDPKNNIKDDGESINWPCVAAYDAAWAAALCLQLAELKELRAARKTTSLLVA